MGNGNEGNYEGKASIFGLMGKIIKEIGKTIKCMEMVFIHGVMEENIKVNIKMTKKKDMEYILMLMEKFIKVSGIMDSNLDKDNYIKETN